MKFQRAINDPMLQRKRALRLRIGRSRRAMDRRWLAAQNEARQLLSWRTYVVRYPAWSLAAALGVGLAVSAGLTPRRASRWIGLSLTRRALAGVRQALWTELRRVWNDANPDR